MGLALPLYVVCVAAGPIHHVSFNAPQAFQLPLGDLNNPTFTHGYLPILGAPEYSPELLTRVDAIVAPTGTAWLDVKDYQVCGKLDLSLETILTQSVRLNQHELRDEAYYSQCLVYS